MIKVSAVTKSFKKEKVLRDISFEVQKGETACIVGQNGSGKSTLLSIIAGTLKPDSGVVEFAEKRGKKDIGFVPQQDYLFEDLKVRDNIKFWAAAANLSFSSGQVKEYIDLFNIHSFLGKKVTELSGGMKKRVALCSSLLHNPEILLLDEPFSGLDIIHKEEICSYLNKLSDEGKTIIYSTHNADEIYLMASNLFVIHNGNIHNAELSNSLDKITTTVMNYLKGAFEDEK